MKMAPKLLAITLVVVGYCTSTLAMNPAKAFLDQIAKSKPSEILGVADNASDVVINKAYKALSIKWHPDSLKNQAYKADAQEVFKKLGEAKEAMLKPGYGQIPQKPAQTASQGQTLPVQIRKKAEALGEEMKPLMKFVDRSKANINEAIKSKWKMGDISWVDYSTQPQTVAKLVYEFLEGLETLVNHSIELKKLTNRNLNPKLVAVIADYAQFLQSVASNKDFISEEKERKSIDDRVTSAISKYEKMFGKLNLTLTAAQKEAQGRAQGTFKMTAEEEANPSSWKGLESQRRIFKEILLPKVQRKVKENVSPYDELKFLITFHKDHIEQLLALERKVRQNNKVLSNPAYYSQWINEAAQTIESFINDPQVKLEDSQRKILDGKLKENRLFFNEKFNK